ncbi:unnamed protein product [Amoebophrya sp. A120]|nr:unnamed protein product [Amoebophrya sp. A120]|eukprot:GSA120T00000566001.1
MMLSSSSSSCRQVTCTTVIRSSARTSGVCRLQPPLHHRHDGSRRYMLSPAASHNITSSSSSYLLPLNSSFKNLEPDLDRETEWRNGWSKPALSRRDDESSCFSGYNGTSSPSLPIKTTSTLSHAIGHGDTHTPAGGITMGQPRVIAARQDTALPPVRTTNAALTSLSKTSTSAAALKMNRKYVQELHRQYVQGKNQQSTSSNAATSLADAQALCDDLARLGTEDCAPELVPKFILDHTVPPANCVAGLEITFLQRHADRWMRLLPSKHHKEVPKMLRALCGCFRVPHLLQLLSHQVGTSGKRGGGGDDLSFPDGTNNATSTARTNGVSSEEETVLPQYFFRKSPTVNSTLSGKVCKAAPPPTKLRERRCGDCHVSYGDEEAELVETKSGRYTGSTTSRVAAAALNGYPQQHSSVHEDDDFLFQPNADPNTLLFVSNLPFDCTTASIRDAYEPFGPIEHVQIFSDRHKNLRAKTALSDQDSAQDAGMERVNANRFSSAYAVLKFRDEAAVANASRDFFRIHGVLVTTATSRNGGNNSKTTTMNGSSSYLSKPDKSLLRATYPEKATSKNTLLLTGLPWQFPLATVLREVGRKLGQGCKNANTKLTLHLANPELFEFPETNSLGVKTSNRVTKLDVQVTASGENAEIEQVPPFDERQFLDTWEDENDEDFDADPFLFLPNVDMDIHEILGNKRYMSEHHNDGILCLRFRGGFSAALRAKRILETLTIGDRAISVEFSPRRRNFVQFDAEGRAFSALVEEGLTWREGATSEQEGREGSSMRRKSSIAKIDGSTSTFAASRDTRTTLPGRYVDFMTPDQSAVYSNALDNPFYAFGT